MVVSGRLVVERRPGSKEFAEFVVLRLGGQPFCGVLRVELWSCGGYLTPLGGVFGGCGDVGIVVVWWCIVVE